MTKLTLSRNRQQSNNRAAKFQARRNITQLPRGNNPGPNKKGMSTKMGAGSPLTKAASDYARLLTDPCNAPLVHGVYPGTGGGIVSRFETDFIIGNGINETAATCVWVPGMNLLFSPGTTLLNDAQLYTYALGNQQTMPGYNFLATIAGSFRCVAACMQVTYPGAELDRSGIVSLGICDSAALVQNLPSAQGGKSLTTNVSQIRSMAQHTERTPATMAEIVWMPGEMDGQNFSFESTSGSPPPAYPVAGDGLAYQGRNSLVFSAAALTSVNLSNSVGMRVRLVYVCEWTPKVNQGLVASIQSQFSPNSVAEILSRLSRANPGWYIHAARAAASYIGNLSTSRLEY